MSVLWYASCLLIPFPPVMYSRCFSSLFFSVRVVSMSLVQCTVYSVSFPLRRNPSLSLSLFPPSQTLFRSRSRRFLPLQHYQYIGLSIRLSVSVSVLHAVWWRCTPPRTVSYRAVTPLYSPSQQHTSNRRLFCGCFVLCCGFVISVYRSQHVLMFSLFSYR